MVNPTMIVDTLTNIADREFLISMPNRRHGDDVNQVAITRNMECIQTEIEPHSSGRNQTQSGYKATKCHALSKRFQDAAITLQQAIDLKNGPASPQSHHCTS